MSNYGAKSHQTSTQALYICYHTGLMGLPITTPEFLSPAYASGVLPDITVDNLATARDVGWESIGIGPIIIDRATGHVLVVKHRPTEKLPAGPWGIPTETTKYQDLEGKRIVPETFLDTFSRLVFQELGFDPRGVRWEASPRNYIVRSAEIADAPGRGIIAVCPGIYADAEEILNRFTPNGEIEEIQFMPPEKAMMIPNMRPSRAAFIGAAAASGLLHYNPGSVEPLTLPDPTAFLDAPDIKMSTMSL